MLHLGTPIGNAGVLAIIKRVPPMTIPFSILDLSPIPQGATASDALRNSLDLAQHAEQWGYQRYWLAEHHNMPGIASAATSIVIAHIAGGTKTIRVGSGGIMLPNHSPLVIAEQFGTLAALFPGRIDLGLGRAPGTDTLTARALRRDLATSSDRFPEDVQELQHYFEEVAPGQKIRAVPGAGLRRPHLAVRLKPVQRAASGAPGPPVRIRLAFRTRSICWMRCGSTATSSSRRSNSTSRTSCWASMSSRLPPTGKRNGTSPHCSNRSPTFAAGCQGRFRLRSTTSTRSGLLRKKR